MGAMPAAKVLGRHSSRPEAKENRRRDLRSLLWFLGGLYDKCLQFELNAGLCAQILGPAIS